jgi:hypothetical protein
MWTKNKLVKTWRTASHSFKTAPLPRIDYKLMLDVAFGHIHTHFFADRYCMAQLVEVLYYNPEGRGFDSRWCHCNFSLT